LADIFANFRRGEKAKMSQRNLAGALLAAGDRKDRCAVALCHNMAEAISIVGTKAYLLN